MDKRRISTSRGKGTLKAAAISASLATAAIKGRPSDVMERHFGASADSTEIRIAAAMLESMEGLVMRLGQVLSYVDLNLVPGIREVLAALQDSAQAMSPEVSEQVFTEDLGMPPSEFLARWERQPFAAVSIGQFHRTLMHDGTEVAVKVQNPEIAAALEAHLSNIAALQLLASPLNRTVDRGALFAGPHDRLLEERESLFFGETREKLEARKLLPQLRRLHGDDATRFHGLPGNLRRVMLSTRGSLATTDPRSKF